MAWNPGHAWIGEASLPHSTKAEAKVVISDNGRFVWESGANRKIDVGKLDDGSPSSDGSNQRRIRTASEGYFTMYWGRPDSTPLFSVPLSPTQAEVIVDGVEVMKAAEGHSEGGVAADGGVATADAAADGEERALFKFLRFLVASGMMRVLGDVDGEVHDVVRQSSKPSEGALETLAGGASGVAEEVALLETEVQKAKEGVDRLRSSLDTAKAGGDALLLSTLMQ